MRYNKEDDFYEWHKKAKGKLSELLGMDKIEKNVCPLNIEIEEDLLQKIEYYLTHDDERVAIAENGFHRLEANHTYYHRVEEILSYL